MAVMQQEVNMRFAVNDDLQTLFWFIELPLCRNESTQSL